MIIVDRPYVSDFLVDYLARTQIPVLDNEFVRENQLQNRVRVVSTSDAKQLAAANLLTTSENSLAWVNEHCAATPVGTSAALLKNKSEFRRRLQGLYPEFCFRQVDFHLLKKLEVAEIPQTPFVVKPNIGFFSCGVHVVKDAEHWLSVRARICEEVERSFVTFPESVVSAASFIMEEFIDGTEYAVDAVFDEQGQPSILGILKHDFSDLGDVSDRIYISSKQIIGDNLENFTSILTKIGHGLNLKNMPVHAEFRVDACGHAVPVEVNPLRFGGWCTSADFTARAFGVNPYACYLESCQPDWPSVLASASDNIFSIIVLNNSTGIAADEIEAFDYEKLMASLSKPLELRKTDYRTYPVFGFVFAETAADDSEELKRLLTSDLSEFVISK